MPKVNGEKVSGMGFPGQENDPTPTRDLGIMWDTRDLGVLVDTRDLGVLVDTRDLGILPETHKI